MSINGYATSTPYAGRSPRGIVIDIDSFVDTRLALLEMIDPSLAVRALVDGYDTRTIDEFPAVSKELFAKLWEGRDARALKEAQPTRIKDLLIEILATGTMQTEAGVGGLPEVYLNTYPYRLTREEARGFIKAIPMLSDGKINVHAVRWAPGDMLPVFVRDQIAVMIMYDYQHWLDWHAKSGAIKKDPIPNTTLFVPELYFGKTPTEEDFLKIKRSGHTAFSLHELAAKGVVTLKHIPISGYCADIEPEVLAAMKNAA